MSRLTVRLTAQETAEKLSFTTTNLKHYAALLEKGLTWNKKEKAIYQ